MEHEHPLVFGDDGAHDIARRPRPELLAVTRKVIGVLEPLDQAARARVVRAVLALLALD
jgi:hypothetical protein